MKVQLTKLREADNPEMPNNIKEDLFKLEDVLLEHQQDLIKEITIII